MNTDEHGWKKNFFLSYLCASVSIRGKKIFSALRILVGHSLGDG